MSFDSFQEFLAMGEHGLYVWSCYGIAVVVIIYNFLAPKVVNRQKINERKRILQRDSNQSPIGSIESTGSENG